MVLRCEEEQNIPIEKKCWCGAIAENCSDWNHLLRSLFGLAEMLACLLCMHRSGCCLLFFTTLWFIVEVLLLGRNISNTSMVHPGMVGSVCIGIHCLTSWQCNK